MNRKPSLRRLGPPAIACALALALVGSAWASSLDVNTSSKFTGNYGLEVTLDSPAIAYVQDDTPAAEPRYRARFYVRPEGFDSCAGTCYVPIFEALDGGGTRALTVLLRQVGDDDLRVRFEVYDGGSYVAKNYAVDPAGWVAVEFDWSAANSSGSQDGYLDVWTNGSARSGLANLDTDNLSIDSVRMGNPDTHEIPGAIVRFDDFESRRDNYIGLITDQLLPPPVLLEPGASTSDNPPTFDWTEVPGATEYRIRIYDDNSNSYVETAETNNTSFTPGSLNSNHDYRWKVSTRSLAGWGSNSPWSDLSFTEPGVPGPLAPQGNVSTNPPTFEWTAVQGASQYRLYVYNYTDREYAPSGFKKNVNSTTYTPSSGLDPTKDWRFKVRARINGNWMPTSSWMDFNVPAGIIAWPTAPSGTIAANPPTLQWTSVAGATKYRVYLWNITDGSYVVKTTLTGTSYSPGALDTNDDYEFRVRAYVNGQWSSYSSWMQFNY